MKCEFAKELFSDYVSGDIEPALKLSLENHFSDCTECSECIADFPSLWGSLDGMEIVEPPPYYHENLMSRITAAANAQEEAEAMRRATWDWRSAFKPRSLAYAASVLALLLAGMGGLHYTRAALDPLGSLLKLMHPAPVHSVELSASRAEWSPNAQGTGKLIVYLKAQAEPDGTANTLNCVVNLPANALAQDAKTDVVVSSDTETSLEIPLKKMPPQSGISVTFSARDSGQPAGAGSKTEPVTLMQPVELPTK